MHIQSKGIKMYFSPDVNGTQLSNVPPIFINSVCVAALRLLCCLLGEKTIYICFAHGKLLNLPKYTSIWIFLSHIEVLKCNIKLLLYLGETNDRLSLQLCGGQSQVVRVDSAHLL